MPALAFTHKRTISVCMLTTPAINSLQLLLPARSTFNKSYLALLRPLKFSKEANSPSTASPTKPWMRIKTENVVVPGIHGWRALFGLRDH